MSAKQKVHFTFDERSLSSVEEMPPESVPLRFTIEDFAVANNLLIIENEQLKTRLTHLRALWHTAPAGLREGLRAYHPGVYAAWCAALGIQE